MSGAAEGVIRPCIEDDRGPYRCSLCGQAFSVPEGEQPGDRTHALWTAFNDHLQHAHPEPGGQGSLDGSWSAAFRFFGRG